MKKNLLFSMVIFVIISVPTAAQEIGLSSGAQLIRGELTAYGNNFTSITSLSAFWDIPKARNFRYGAELRYASMNVSPEFENSWLDTYESRGSDFSAMLSMRYYFNTPKYTTKRAQSLLFWTHFGAGLHIAQFESVNMGVGPKVGDAIQGDFNESRTIHTGALEVGFGAQYYITDRWSMSFSSGGQFTGNDYLDGVAGIGNGKDFPFYMMLGGSYLLPNFK
ncbi:MAG: hypothetical protein HWD92_09080 [Flavobacteriia bacterium]|nr:hypothetical protein [Flavobacteriia bacterium]